MATNEPNEVCAVCRSTIACYCGSPTVRSGRCPHCYGDHDGCTIDAPACSAGRSVLPSPQFDDLAATHTKVATSPIVALRARWAVANNAWLVTFGDAPCGIGPDNRRLFSTRKELRAVVEACGLQLLPSGMIVAKN